MSLDWAIEYGGHAQRKSTDPIRRSAEIDDPKRETVSMLDGICPPNTMLSRVSKNTETLGFSDEPGMSGAPRRHQSLQPIVPNAEMLVPGPLKEKNALPPLILGPMERLACVETT